MAGDAGFEPAVVLLDREVRLASTRIARINWCPLQESNLGIRSFRPALEPSQLREHMNWSPVPRIALTISALQVRRIATNAYGAYQLVPRVGIEPTDAAL